MRRFVIDIGNTRIKTALFDEDLLLSEQSFVDLGSLNVHVGTLDIEAVMVSSVTYSEADLRDSLDFPYQFLSRTTHLPFQNLYTTPDTLGVDRKAAVMGARAKFPKDPVLAIDMGSCITYDLMDRDDRYLGGGISPGMQMRLRAMHQQTARLPLVELDPSEVPELIGDSTETCMQSGVYYGILHEIQGTMAAYLAKYPDLKVIICGGDSKIFESLTKDHIFVIPNLVLFGLNRILSYNVHYQ